MFSMVVWQECGKIATPTHACTRGRVLVLFGGRLINGTAYKRD
jgi:hypothetical protein